MSDDLISRKSFMEYLGLEDTEENREENVGEIVTLEDFDRQATAFDKEKVIVEFRKRSHNFYPSIDHYCLSQKAVNLKDATEIVEKGGIE